MSSQFVKNVKEYVKYWYLPLLIGVILIITGIWTFKSPAESYLGLSFIFSISFLTSGFLEIFFAFANKEEMDNWGWTLVLGIMTTLFGVFLLSRPEISMVSLPIYIGFMIMFRSYGAMGIAMDLKNYGVVEWGTLMVLGILGLIFSFFLIWNPVFAGMTVVFWTGMALLMSGVFNIYLALKMKNLHKNWDKVSGEIKEKFEEVKDMIQSQIEKESA